MSHYRPPRTDAGTVALHWLIVGCLLVSLGTGLRIAADDLDLTPIRRLDLLLPAGNVWRWHVASGLVLAVLLIAYLVYIWRAGLMRRTRLDRARLAGLRHKGRTRRGLCNVAIVWAILSALLSQIATGVCLYFGHGGTIVSLHIAATVALIVLACLHVLGHWSFGGINQILRILRPTRLAPPAAAPSLADLIARQFQRDDVSASKAPDLEEPSSRDVALFNHPFSARFETHPLAVAAALAMTFGILALTMDRGIEPRVVIARVDPAEAPVLDGDLADPVWRRAAPVSVHTIQGANLGGSGQSRVDIRAVHDGTFVYIALTWDDPTRSLKHLPLIKRADGWRVLQRAFDIEDENDYYEDKLAVMLSASDRLAAAGTIHLGSRPLSGKPEALSGRGLHFTTDGSIVDVWHWKAARGGLLGYMDDNFFGPPAEPTQAETEGKARYKAGYATDPGAAFYAHNFKPEAPGGYRGPVLPLRLPKSLAATLAAMGRIDLDVEHGEAEGTRWWMTEEESAPYSAARDAAIPVGTVIPGVIISGRYSGDRADIRCAARWAAGRWTLEVVRRIDTRSPRDLPIASGIYLWVAVFDHTQTRHSRHMRPVRLEVAP